ncbi:response regulator [Clostridium arbusti]|nr:response regulator [Clostridium arbusti]
MQDKVLVVDDEKNILDVLAYALKREGYLVDTAYNGKEALHKNEKIL